MDPVRRETRKMRELTVPEGMPVTVADGTQTFIPPHLNFESPHMLFRANCVVSLDFDTRAHSC